MARDVRSRGAERGSHSILRTQRTSSFSTIAKPTRIRSTTWPVIRSTNRCCWRCDRCCSERVKSLARFELLSRESPDRACHGQSGCLRPGSQTGDCRTGRHCRLGAAALRWKRTRIGRGLEVGQPDEALLGCDRVRFVRSPAAELASDAEPLVADESMPVRIRAAEFLGQVGTINPQEV